MPSPVSTHSFHISAEADAYCLLDRGQDDSLELAWNDDFHQLGLGVEGGAAAARVARSMTVPVELNVFASEPDRPLGPWQHVVDGSIDVMSGELGVFGLVDPPDTIRWVPLAPGTWRVRTYAAGLDTLDEDGLTGDDHYCVDVWPGSPCAPTLLKRGFPEEG